MKIGILGGGLTGLTLANLLHHDVEVLEKEPECGGLCRSLSEQGFTFDYGGCHILFSKDEPALNFILTALGENKARNRRNNKVLYEGRYIKYPFENDLGGLSPQDNFDCLYGFIQAWLARNHGELAPPRNFREWCYQTFGQGIADKYLIPYNEKIWKFPTEGLSVNWVQDRVPQPPVEDVIKSALGIQTEGYTHQLHYYYPRQGGIQAVIRSLERLIQDGVVTGFEVRKVASANGRWQVSDGRNLRTYDRIVSTIPLFDLARAVGDVPEQVKEALAGLRYNRLITVLLGVDRPRLNDFTALYIPDPGVLPHRLGFLSNFSLHNAPEGKSSVLAEITCALDDSELWSAPNDKLIARVTNDLTRLGILPDARTVCYSIVTRSEYAYVIYDHAYHQNLKLVKDFFRSQGIVLAGRFAEFEYLNMDACVRRAMVTAEALNRDA